MLREDYRKSALLGSIAMLVMIVACAASVWGLKLAVPEHVDADTISISYADYDQAFLKWQASNIDKYEITLRGGDHDVVLRVADAGTSVEVVRHLFRGEPIDVSSLDDYSAELREMSVEHMFGVVQSTIEIYHASDLPRSDDNSYSFFYDLNVRFDPSLGYPDYIAEYRRTIRPSRELTWREVSWTPVEVTSFKVLDGR